MRERKIEKFLIKSPKQMIMVIAVFTLMIFVGGTTYAFFNYTRTGGGNTVRVGRISFTSSQSSGSDNKINLSNVFPISSSNVSTDTNNVGTLEIAVTGDTDYSGGIEYLVSSTNTNVTTSTGTLVPLSLQVSVNALGTPSNNYFTARETTTSNIYKKLVGDTLVGDQMLLVGFITPNNPTGTIAGVNGTITIKAYFDESKVLISDTYNGTESDNMGTPNSLAEGKTVLTTTEWNSFVSSGISFQIKVEAREGIWVNGSLEEIMRKESIGIDTENGVDFSKTSDQDGTKGVYMRAGTQDDAYPIVYYRGAVEDNNVIFNNKCWKAVRTTDTGGVKLIYNGEMGHVYENTDQELSNYASVNKVTDVTDVSAPFTFDPSDSTWNIELTGAGNTEFEFTVPSGDNYNLVMTGTSGSSCGGTMTFYKDGATMNSASQGGGNAMNLTYSYGSLTSSNKIKMTYNGSSSTTCPITFKIKMEQNSQALSSNQYTIIANGIYTSKKWTFDENEKEWYTIVPNGSSTKISFSVADGGNYGLKYTATGGPISIKKGDSVLSSTTGTNTMINLGTVSTSDEYSVEYQQMAPGSGRIEFALVERKDLGIGCDNSGTASQITLSGTNTFPFSVTDLYKSPAYVGYMWGTVYEYSKSNWTSGAKFGSGFTWDGTNYKLTDATVTTPNDTHHYSCNSTDAEATCTSIRYVYWVNESNKYYITISDGKGIEEAIKDMQTNTTPSNAKTQIDAWYLSNMNTVTSKLEDTIWCNDRSIGRYNGWSSTGTINGSGSDYESYSLLFGAYERSSYASGTSTVKNQPSLVCTNKNDAFTVKNGKGNQKLTYPVALLTEDEMVLAGGLAGSTSSFYLRTGSTYWSLSPYLFYIYGAHEFFVYSSGNLVNNRVTDSYGLRPSVSLKPGLSVIKGTGTVTDPYVIE